MGLSEDIIDATLDSVERDGAKFKKLCNEGRYIEAQAVKVMSKAKLVGGTVAGTAANPINGPYHLAKRLATDSNDTDAE